MRNFAQSCRSCVRGKIIGPVAPANMPPRRAASPKAAKSPKPAPSPMAPRSSPRAHKAPARLGIDDSWGEGSARSWKTDVVPVQEADKAEEKVEETKKGGSVVGFADVLTLAVGFGLYGFGLKLKGLTPEDLLPVMPLPMMTVAALVLTALVVAGSHLIYGFIWYYPKKFAKLCKKAPLKFFGKHAVAVFGKAVLFWKTMQQIAVILFAAGYSVDALKKLALAPTMEEWGLTAVLILLGQVLNAAIYKAIGADGVYYGFKLGRPVPWSSAFPFNAGYRHPQYVGAVLSQLGVLLPLTTAATLDLGLGVLTAYWVTLYVITSIIEASGDNDKD